MQVTEIDVHDDAMLKDWWETARDADADGREYPAFWSLRSATVAFRAENNSAEQHPLAAFEGGEIVGVNQVMFPLLDNTRMAYLEPLVSAKCRRRGVGTALLGAGLDMARNAGRTIIVAEAHMPLAADKESSGSAFLSHHGFEKAIVDLHRVLDLPIATTRLHELRDASAPHHRHYRLVSWVDDVPDEHVAGYCDLQMAFNAEAPMGDLEIEAEIWDEKRVREREQRFRDQGRHETVTAAIAADGTMAGITEMMTTDEQRHLAWQGGTLVLPGHRGHRLGIALKAANQERYQERFPETRTLHSWNAEENGPMVAINDTLGFRPVERLAEMQLRLSTDAPLSQ
jgi:GNAT superfamily N-acetyltransferase